MVWMRLRLILSWYGKGRRLKPLLQTRRFVITTLVAFLSVFSFGCVLIGGAVEPTAAPVLQPTPTLFVTPTVALPTATVAADSGWQVLRTGLEKRVINVVDGNGRLVESVYLLRFEPAYYQFGVAYRPGEPLSLEAWQAETGALVVMNGGYFTELNVATGLIVSNGQASGASYGDFAGMLAVTAEGPELRWLGERPYDPNETLVAAVQSFPLLVKPGGLVGFPDEDGLVNRRTVVAQDRQGRILFLVAPGGYFTLHQLSIYLVNSDLDLDIALNLDGGTSTGLLLAEPAEGIGAYTLLPAVITVHKNE
jgi:uncharacterized protein YigE (DUF2233 family)